MKLFTIEVPEGTLIKLEAKSKQEIIDGITRHNGVLLVGDGELMTVDFPKGKNFTITEEE